MGNLFKAHIFKQRTRGSREEVKIKLFNMDDSPFELGDGAPGGSGGGPSIYISGHNIQKGVLGTTDFLYFDGSENNLDIVGIPLSDGQSIELPSGIYTSTFSVGFDTAHDDGVGDITRLFRAEIQPTGKQLEKSWDRPAGGWADHNPYTMEHMGWNFVLDEPNDLIVMVDGTTADDNGVTYHLSFTIIKLGDIPVEEG